MLHDIIISMYYSDAAAAHKCGRPQLIIETPQACGQSSLLVWFAGWGQSINKQTGLFCYFGPFQPALARMGMADDDNDVLGVAKLLSAQEDSARVCRVCHLSRRGARTQFRRALVT